MELPLRHSKGRTEPPSARPSSLPLGGGMLGNSQKIEKLHECGDRIRFGRRKFFFFGSLFLARHVAVVPPTDPIALLDAVPGWTLYRDHWTGRTSFECRDAAGVPTGQQVMFMVTPNPVAVRAFGGDPHAGEWCQVAISPAQYSERYPRSIAR